MQSTGSHKKNNMRRKIKERRKSTTYGKIAQKIEKKKEAGCNLVFLTRSFSLSHVYINHLQIYIEIMLLFGSSATNDPILVRRLLAAFIHFIVLEVDNQQTNNLSTLLMDWH